jgi:hypothetical protein
MCALINSVYILPPSPRSIGLPSSIALEPGMNRSVVPSAPATFRAPSIGEFDPVCGSACRGAPRSNVRPLAHKNTTFSPKGYDLWRMRFSLLWRYSVSFRVKQ